MRSRRLPTLDRYASHLDATSGWLLRSIENGRGGSCAYYRPGTGWSRPYPETSGYLVPTLLRISRRSAREEFSIAAVGVGRWLLGLQRPDGAWPGGLHPPGGPPNASVFNTGQIIKGMIALHNETKDVEWLDAARRGASWLASGVDERGLWPKGNYRVGFNPSYYSQVAWPMLEAWSRTREDSVRDAAERVLRRIAERRLPSGVIRGWGFDEERPAFTHTIAYTLRGLLESARILDDWDAYGRLAVPALEKIRRLAELSGGRLPGAFDEDWRPVRWYTCLTGNAQLALCLLRWEAREGDLRLVNAAAKLVDAVCDSQSIRSPAGGVRGGVAGSSPLWGRYMTFRYPNWAAKYHADALMALEDRLLQETG